MSKTQLQRLQELLRRQTDVPPAMRESIRRRAVREASRGIKRKKTKK